MARSPFNLREHGTVVLVALGVIALALPNGGYSAGVYAAVTLLVWWAVVLALALGLGPQGHVPTAALVAGGALAALATFSMLSIAWAADAGRAYAEAVRAAGYAGIFTLVVIAARRDAAGRWLAGLAIGFAGVAALALLSRFLPSLPGGDSAIVARIPVAAGRLSYPIGYWNGLAASMAVAIALLSWLGGFAQSRLGRALAIGAIPACGLVIYLASSRGGAAAAVAGIAVLVLLGTERLRLLAGIAIGGVGAVLLVALGSRFDELVNGVSGDTATSQGHELLVATILVVGAAAVVRWFLDDAIADWRISETATRTALIAGAVVVIAGVIAANPVKRLDEFNDPPSDAPPAADFVASHTASTSGTGRYQFWSAALDAFGDHPVGGLGAGGYETYWNQHASISRAAGNPHSIFLQALSELGIVGLGLVLAFFGAIAVAALRRLAAIERRAELAAAAAVVGAGLLSAAIDWTWQLPVVFASVVIAGALLTGSALHEPGTEGRSRQGLGFATLGFAWLAICAAAILMFSEARLEASRDAAADGDLAAASDDAKQAAALEPWSAGPRLQLALVDELQGDLPVARERIEQAIDRSPDDWELWLARARIETKLGDVDSATRSLARARSLNPRSPLFQQLDAQ